MIKTLKPEDIRWRVSNTWDSSGKKMGMLVGYIDSRLAMEQLDDLDPNWSTRMEPITLNGSTGVRCTLTVKGVSREDVGVPSNTEPLKGAFSDALKRAAVHFGIGRELYELPKIAVECEVGRDGKAKAPKATPVFKDGRWTIDRKYGWVKYEREPQDDDSANDEPGDGEREPTRRSATSPATTRRRAAGAARRDSDSDPGSAESAAPPPDNYRRDELLELAQAKGLDREALERYAAMVGVPNGHRANHEQMDQLIEVIQQHRNELPDGEQEESADTPSAEGNPDSPPAEPPRPDTDEYRALPSGTERAAARAYWEQRKDGEQVSLAAALGAPESDR